jgi:hypothetical protein
MKYVVQYEDGTEIDAVSILGPFTHTEARSFITKEFNKVDKNEFEIDQRLSSSDRLILSPKKGSSWYGDEITVSWRIFELRRKLVI